MLPAPHIWTCIYAHFRVIRVVTVCQPPRATADAVLVYEYTWVLDLKASAAQIPLYSYFGSVHLRLWRETFIGFGSGCLLQGMGRV